jgi:hypothetical protein
VQALPPAWGRESLGRLVWTPAELSPKVQKRFPMRPPLVPLPVWLTLALLRLVWLARWMAMPPSPESWLKQVSRATVAAQVEQAWVSGWGA